MASAKAKTSLACDRCRQRKSRCDGTRPRCSYCTTAGVECSYRPTPTNLETDESILSRLADVESRLASLEGSDAPKPKAEHDVARPPLLHTAAAHQMLHSWPRVRVCLAMPGFESLKFLEEASRADAFPESVPEPLQVWQLVRPIQLLCSQRHVLPALLLYITEEFEEFRPENVLNDLEKLDQRSVIEMKDLPNPHLMVLSMALSMSPSAWGDDAHQLAAASKAAFSALNTVLSRQWMLTDTRDIVVQGLTLSHSLLYTRTRPFHALRMLQSIQSTMKRWSLRKRDDGQLLSCCRIYLVLESDILTEIDEYGSDTILSGGDGVAADILSAPQVNHGNVSISNMQMDEDGCPPISTYVDGHVWLRRHLNRILHLYTPKMAYARPHELADLVAKLSAQLRQWYDSQPLDRRFPRDLSTWNMSSHHLTAHDRELAARYLSCIFFIHRPVLYFFLHKEMEYSIQPPESDSAMDHEPWVLESCRDCIETAALISRICGGGAEHSGELLNGFGDYQLLFAAYLVILQVKNLEVLNFSSRGWIPAERILDNVERSFIVGKGDSAVLERSLSVLQNVRAAFDAQSPRQAR